jgi:S-formylglutathione hydrolase FrmB
MMWLFQFTPMRKLLWLFALLCLVACRQNEQPANIPDVEINSPAQIDTLSTARSLMGDTAHTLVILPQGYAESTDSFPVVYLLHGYSGNHESWLSQFPELIDWASLFQQIIVMPDGAYNSWYLDSPMKTSQKMATYIGQELPALIDQRYRTIKDQRGRAITGLSMGGHGAMYLAIQFPEQFGAVSSMSGGLDLRPFPDNWELREVLGDPVAFAKNWENYSVINRLDEFQGRDIPILIDCGVEDFFFEINQASHDRLLELGIPHDYVVRPGAHTWDYWRKVAPQHLLFFDQFFEE